MYPFSISTYEHLLLKFLNTQSFGKIIKIYWTSNKNFRTITVVSVVHFKVNLFQLYNKCKIGQRCNRSRIRFEHFRCRCALCQLQVSTLSGANKHCVRCKWALCQVQVSTVPGASEHSVRCEWALCQVQVSTVSGASEHCIRCKWALFIEVEKDEKHFPKVSFSLIVLLQTGQRPWTCTSVTKGPGKTCWT